MSGHFHHMDFQHQTESLLVRGSRTIDLVLCEWNVFLTLIKPGQSGLYLPCLFVDGVWIRPNSLCKEPLKYCEKQSCFQAGGVALIAHIICEPCIFLIFCLLSWLNPSLFVCRVVHSPFYVLPAPNKASFTPRAQSRNCYKNCVRKYQILLWHIEEKTSTMHLFENSANLHFTVT